MSCFACGTRLTDPVSPSVLPSLPEPTGAAAGVFRAAGGLTVSGLPPRRRARPVGQWGPRPKTGTWPALQDGPPASSGISTAAASDASVDSASAGGASSATLPDVVAGSEAAPLASAVPACAPCLTGGHFPGCRPLHSGGYWNPCCPCLFGSLSGGVLEHMMSFLAPRDVASLAAVSSRFAWASASSELWSRTTLRVISAPEPAALLVPTDRLERLVAPSTRPAGASAPAASASEAAAATASARAGAPSQLLSPSNLAAPLSLDPHELSTSGLAALIRLHGPAVRRLEARGFDPAAFPTAAAEAAAGSGPAFPTSLGPLRRLVNLRDLDLAGSKRLGAAHLLALVRANPSLQRLVLSGCAAAVDDATVEAVASSCQGLQHLSLARCRALTAASLGALAASGALRRLHSLDLSGISGISGADVVAAFSSAGPLPSMRSLWLRGLRGLDDAALAAIAAACPGLVALDVGAADATGCMATLAIARHNPDITAAGLAALAAAPCSRTLTSLGLRGRAGLALSVGALEASAAALKSLPLLETVDLELSARAVGGMWRRDPSGATSRVQALVALAAAEWGA